MLTSQPAQGCARGDIMSSVMSSVIDRFIATFNFLGNLELVPDPTKIQELAIAEVPAESLLFRPYIEDEDGGGLDSHRAWLLDGSGGVLTEVGLLETVGEAAAHNPGMRYAIRIERGHTPDHEESWYEITIHRSARLSLVDREPREGIKEQSVSIYADGARGVSLAI